MYPGPRMETLWLTRGAELVAFWQLSFIFFLCKPMDGISQICLSSTEIAGRILLLEMLSPLDTGCCSCYR